MRLAAVFACMALLAPCRAHAATFLVRPDGTGDFPAIGNAIEACADRDTILLADGTFTGPANRDLHFGNRWYLTLRSQSGDPAACIIDCGGSESEPHRGLVLYDGDGPVRLVEGITFANGYASSFAQYTEGGAIFCHSETEITVHDCIFSSNAATQGGAIFCSFLSRVRLDGCRFIDNHATSGGAIAIWGSAYATLARCTFSGNTAAGEGGAVWRDGLSPMASLEECTFSMNAATAGAGVFTRGAPVSLEQVIVVASPLGEAVACDTGGLAYLRCCDLYANAGGDWVGCIADQLGADGNLELDPQFCSTTPDADRNWQLQEDSPAVAGPCIPMGAWPVGCATSAITHCSWGVIKTVYR
jgi:predicted outer membrane repeat protein